MERKQKEIIRQAFKILQHNIYEINKANGWWPELENLEEAILEEDIDRQHAIRNKINIAERIALIHSELSEALEAARAEFSKQDEHCPAFTNFSIELADAVIRIMNLAEAKGISLGEAILAKLEVNKKRGFRHGNKRF